MLTLVLSGGVRLLLPSLALGLLAALAVTQLLKSLLYPSGCDRLADLWLDRLLVGCRCLVGLLAPRVGGNEG